MFDGSQKEPDNVPYVGSVCEDSFCSVRLLLLANNQVGVCTWSTGNNNNVYYILYTNSRAVVDPSQTDPLGRAISR